MRTVLQQLLLAAILLHAARAEAQNICPPPPDPNDGFCSLQIDNSVLREADANLNGQPDNRGSTGSFCGGNSDADCTGSFGAEVGFNLIIADPSTQTVTCTAPGVEVWIMSAGCGTCLASGLGSATLPAGTTAATTLAIVVSDTNFDVCECGPLLTCTYSNEAECSDGADGDGDGLIDAADPDCCVDADGDGFCGASDCDDDNPLVHEPPTPLDIRLSVGAAGNARILWTAQPGAVADGISGLLSDLEATPIAASCLFNDRSGSVYTDSRPAPPSGAGDFYLLRAQNSCGASTFGSGPALDAANICP